MLTWLACEHPLEVLTRKGLIVRRNVLGSAGCDNLTATIAAFGSKVDDPVCGFDDIEIVLNDNDRIPFVLAQRAYSATTRIITTADEMLDELIRIKR